MYKDGYPLLLAYQSRWNQEQAEIAICEKSRRIGLSWGDAAERVVYAAEGKGHVFYMSYNKDMTETYIRDCAEWAERFNLAASEVEETLISDEQSQVLRYRITFDSGKCIQALPSNPRVLRSKGKPGDIVIIDEAAFCDELDDLLQAAIAVTQWGGKVRIISTHKGEDSAFNHLVCAVRDGKHDYTLHRITLDDAISEGLARRIASVKRAPWHEGYAEQWCAHEINKYPTREMAEEELFCIPKRSGGAWLAWQWLRAAEQSDAGLAEYYAGGLTYLGIDVARRQDLWVAVIIERVGDVLWVRELIVRQGISFAEQHSIVARLVNHYRPVRIAVDQTGMGEAVVEQLEEAHGKYRVEGVLLSASKRLDVATALREVFEDGHIRIPKDEALRADLHSIKAETSITGAPRLVAARSGTDGHADRFWALALACASARTQVEHFAYEAVSPYYDEDSDAGNPYSIKAQRGLL